MPNATLLIVDDDPRLRDLLETVLSLSDFEVLVAAHTPEGLQLAATRNLDAVFVGYEMSGLNGVQFCQALHQQNRRLLLSDVPVWIMTRAQDESMLREARGRGAHGIIVKPPGGLELGQLILKTVRAHLATAAL